jgi:peptide deformylase
VPRSTPAYRATPATWQLPPGQVRPITRWGDPLMHRPLAEVTSFDGDLGQLVADMFATMDAADGVGLAANQVGVDLAVFVFDLRPDPAAGPDDDEGQSADGPLSPTDLLRLVGVVCNPTLTIPETGDGVETEKDSEGCLSLPGAFVPCRRASLAVVSGFDHTGQPVRYQGRGLLARCLQHEADHLRGVVFADLLPGRHRRKLHSQAARLAGNYPDDWPVTPQRTGDD